jgi:hypothetical protein
MIAKQIRLFSKVGVNGIAGHTDPKTVATFNQEVATLGFTFTRDLMDRFEALDPASFARERTLLLPELIALSGAEANHIHLFNQFPYSVPDQETYLINRIVGFLKDRFGMLGKDVAALSCGHRIDRRQFDLDAFGACPICQFSVAELRSPEGARYTYRELTPLKPIGYLSKADAVGTAEKMLARPSSLSADEKSWLRAFIAGGVELSLPKTVFRETLPFVYHYGGAQAVKPYLASATDILRIAAFLSAPEADLSLKEPVKFSLTTAHKKQLLSLLDAQKNVKEDMLRRRERWLRFGEHVKIGSSAFRTRFPFAAQAFDDIRNRPKTIQTFNRTAERGIREKAISGDFLAHLATRPGEFARKLDFMLRTSEHPNHVVGAARHILPELTTKLLFELEKYFKTRGTLKNRIFLPKGDENRMHVARDRRQPISTEALSAIQALFYDELMGRLSLLEPLGSVYVDPLLTEHLIPFNRRGDSATLNALSKGSRYPFAGDIVRLFVHWVGHVDVDLSIILYDDDLCEKGHVAFTNLQYPGCLHSGDVQDAPNGASEFIDFEIASLTQLGIRYVASSVHSFRGQTFANFPCFAGFMQRDSLGSGDVYEPASVAQKFDLSTANTSHMPLVFDLSERKVIFSDLAAGNRRHGRVAGEQDKHKLLLESVLTMGERKPTLFDLMVAHVAARGTHSAPGMAERSFGPEQAEEIVRDFLDTLP